MQRKQQSFKSSYFNIWLSLAKLLSLLIFVYCCLFSISCRHHPPKQVLTIEDQTIASESALNINSANVQELEKLPRIGEETARKIVEHREKYGAFQRPEDLILVRGMSDKKFREIRSLIKVE